jgi:hypothetical protein
VQRVAWNEATDWRSAERARRRPRCLMWLNGQRLDHLSLVCLSVGCFSNSRIPHIDATLSNIRKEAKRSHAGGGYTSFGSDVTALLSHRAFHKQHRERNHKGKHGDHPKGVEIGERRRLRLTQILECLRGQLLRRHRIAGLLQALSHLARRGSLPRLVDFAKSLNLLNQSPAVRQVMSSKNG